MTNSKLHPHSFSVLSTHIPKVQYELARNLQLPPISTFDPNCLPPALVDSPLRHGKLALVLDLDQTLVHAIPIHGLECFPFLEHFLDDEGEPSLYKFATEATGFRFFYLKLRPYLRGFLGILHQYFELSIFTNGLQSYADIFLAILDPDRKYFGNRVIARPNHVANQSKNISRLYSTEHQRYVVLFDDRVDVWLDATENQILQAEEYSWLNNYRNKLQICYPRVDKNAIHDILVSTVIDTPNQKSVESLDASDIPSFGACSTLAQNVSRVYDYDKHLMYMTKVLLELHRRFFLNPAEASVGPILKAIKGEVLSGISISLTGFNRTWCGNPNTLEYHDRVEKMQIMKDIATSLGAQMDDECCNKSSILIAARRDTANYASFCTLSSAVKVHALWLLDCQATWQIAPYSTFDSECLCQMYRNKIPKNPQRKHWHHRMNLTDKPPIMEVFPRRRIFDKEKLILLNTSVYVKWPLSTAFQIFMELNYNSSLQNSSSEPSVLSDSIVESYSKTSTTAHSLHQNSNSLSGSNVCKIASDIPSTPNTDDACTNLSAKPNFSHLLVNIHEKAAGQRVSCNRLEISRSNFKNAKSCFWETFQSTGPYSHQSVIISAFEVIVCLWSDNGNTLPQHTETCYDSYSIRSPTTASPDMNLMASYTPHSNIINAKANSENLEKWRMNVNLMASSAVDSVEAIHSDDDWDTPSDNNDKNEHVTPHLDGVEMKKTQTTITNVSCHKSTSDDLSHSETQKSNSANSFSAFKDLLQLHRKRKESVPFSTDEREEGEESESDSIFLDTERPLSCLSPLKCTNSINSAIAPLAANFDSKVSALDTFGVQKKIANTDYASDSVSINDKLSRSKHNLPVAYVKSFQASASRSLKYCNQAKRIKKSSPKSKPIQNLPIFCSSHMPQSNSAFTQCCSSSIQEKFQSKQNSALFPILASPISVPVVSTGGSQMFRAVAPLLAQNTQMRRNSRPVMHAASLKSSNASGRIWGQNRGSISTWAPYPIVTRQGSEFPRSR